MCNLGIKGEGELSVQPANPGLPEKMAVETKFVHVCVHQMKTLPRMHCELMTTQ